MALQATVHHIRVSVSDVDRGIYETLDLRVAQHPSENLRFLVLRVLAYALSYEEGIAFSKGGLSSTSEPPLAVHDRTGALRAWIDVGSPSAERLHKASKAAPHVAVYTAADLGQLRREAASRPIHQIDKIDVWRLPPTFLDALAAKLGRGTKLTLTRSDGVLYVSVAGETFETPLVRESLASS